LPDRPGVYLLRDAKDRVIYVGKARSLCRRVPSHFRGLSQGNIVSPIGCSTARIDFIVTSNEAEALVLEDNLIKSYRPRFNCRLKDDKTFPYVRITLGEDFPRVEKTRRIIRDGSRYFGPYANVKALNGLLKSLLRVVPLATCQRPITPGKRSRPCLEYDIGRCPAPCTGKISKEEYAALVEQFMLILTGRHRELEGMLHRAMVEASRNQEYEKAALLRDRLRAVQRARMSQRATMWIQLPGHRDVLGLARSGREACVQLLVVREGRIVGQQTFILAAPQEHPDSEVIEAFIKQYYIRATDIPEEVVIPIPLESSDFLSGWLASRRSDGRQVRIIHPTSGPRLSLLEMATENAQFNLQRLATIYSADEQRIQRAFKELAKLLRLPCEPRHIEGFDISTLQGASPVGSCVVFHDGYSDKRHYRRYKIRSVAGQDDFAMIGEVVRRRYRRLLAEGASLPDLIVVDGGRGQLNAALAALRDLGAEDIPVIGIAKGEEPKQDMIYVPWQPSPLTLSEEALRLLQRVRDEAHRFAIAYHRRLRRKKGMHLTLTEIPGIGPRRATLLLQRFGSLKALAQASIEDVASVPTMTQILAKRVLDYLAEHLSGP